MAEYESQYQRMERWLDRIAIMAEKGDRELKPVELRDFFIAYFQTCYHVKDYLKNDPKVRVSEPELQSFIDTNDCMALCADICNATKHLYLNSSGWSKEDPQIDERASATVSAATGESSATFRVNTNSGKKDAYELAKECRETWDEFLRSKGLPAP